MFVQFIKEMADFLSFPQLRIVNRIDTALILKIFNFSLLTGLQLFLPPKKLTF